MSVLQEPSTSYIHKIATDDPCWVNSLQIPFIWNKLFIQLYIYMAHYIRLATQGCKKLPLHEWKTYSIYDYMHSLQKCRRHAHHDVYHHQNPLPEDQGGHLLWINSRVLQPFRNSSYLANSALSISMSFSYFVMLAYLIFSITYN